MSWFGFALNIVVGLIVGWVIRDEQEACAAKRRHAIIEQGAAELPRDWIN